MKSPDVAWISNEKWDAIPNIDKQKFPYVTPEFIIELMSPFDRLGAAKEKMEKWIANGVSLGWLIDPKTETTVFPLDDGGKKSLTAYGGFLCWRYSG